MPLVSKLFKDNVRLQACLTSDPAHVTPGSNGLHVHLIQIALMIIDELTIAEGEYRAQQYGPSTAAAVLEYKRSRDIVNKNYQTTADNIVGKMTIASLDNELKQLQDIPLDTSVRVFTCACQGIALPVRTENIPPISQLTCERVAAECRDEILDQIPVV